MLKKKTTIYDIARELDVTVSTVSRALNHSKSISSATKKAVWEMAKKLDYSPNKLAASLKSGKTHTIGVIVPSTRVRFFAMVIHSIEFHLKNAGYGILLYQTNENLESEKQGVKTLLEAQVDGIIASLSLETTTDVSHFNEVVKQRKALVLFDRTNTQLNVPSVTLNDFKAGYIATEHLIKNGFRKIAFYTTKHQVSIFKERLKGHESAILDYASLKPESIVVYGNLSIEDGKTESERILDSSFHPDAIIAGDDFTALGVIQNLKGRQNAWPAVLGFANETFSEFITPSLTSIEQQPQKMGAECARLFLSIIDHNEPNKKPEKIIIEPILVERESTRAKVDA